jgi:hypothetical protein
MRARIKMITVQKKKGISTFIATLLLMVLAISAGVVIYAYTMGYLGSFGGPTTMGAISLDTAALDTGVSNNTDSMTAYIRNIGKSPFQASTVYVNGVQIQSAGWSFNSGNALDENKVGSLKIKLSITPIHVGNTGYYFRPSITYDVKVIGIDNTQLSFQVKG